ncbi:MAG TPA: hypothetical protein VKA46_20770 [Gemmataceae bacterium]|nr:hypothetical protein [Gemmataceae bacterium]
MRNTVEIEDIEQSRLRAGIDDVELREEIRELQVGDFVRLTFLTHTASFETLLVRITSIRGAAFRGKLADSPTSTALSNLRAGSAITFTAAHIHSLPRQRPAHDP